MGRVVTLAELQQAASPQVLIHLCCGPCGLMPVLRLREAGMRPTGLFHNPNIHPLTEYLRRREAAAQTAYRLQLPMLWTDEPIDFLEELSPRGWNIVDWLAAVHDPAIVSDPSSPDRCAYCYRVRLLLTARAAQAGGFAAFTTSLLYSTMQHHDMIREEAARIAEQVGIPFLYHDFRQDWQEGIDLSRTWELYRQNYCGCIYSEAERFARKLAPGTRLNLKPQL